MAILYKETTRLCAGCFAGKAKMNTVPGSFRERSENPGRTVPFCYFWTVCHGLSLRERWHCEAMEAMTERARMQTKNKNTAIRTLFERVIVSLCCEFYFAGLALSGADAPALPKGEPLAKRRPGTDAGKIKAVSRKHPMLLRGPAWFADIADAPSGGGTGGCTRCGQSGYPAKAPHLCLRWCG